MRAGIRLKIIGFTVCIALLVGGSISLQAMYVGRQRILAIFERDSRETTVFIASALANNLYTLDIRGLRSQLANARVNPSVIHTYVMDLEGAVLADGTPENTLRDQHLTGPFIRDILGSSGWISRTEERVLKVGGPVLMPDGRRIGHLLVAFSSEEAYRIVRETARANLYLTALFLGIGAVLALLASARVSRPISAMVQTAGEIGRGNLESRVAVTRADELGFLARSINQMAHDLSTTTVSRAYLDRIVTSMADALIVLGPDGTIQRINQATSRLLGYPEAELIGRPLAAVCRDGLVEEGGADGRPEHASTGAGERTFLTKDGRRIPVSFSVSAMREADGEPPGSVCLAQDITERKQIEEALRERVKELNCLYGIAGVIEKEDSLEKTLQGIADLMPGGWSHPDIVCARIVVPGRQYHTENFRETDWRQSADLTVNGQPVGMVEVCYLEERPIRDEGPFLKEEGALLNEIARRLGRVIERKRAEELLRTANDELEKRVQARTVHLVAANEAQQVALRDLKWAQDHLSEQRAQLAGIIASAMEAIVTVDEDGLVIVFNQEAERIFRLPAAEAVGRSVERLIPDRFRAAHTAGFRRLGGQGAVGYRIGLDRPAYALRADGEEFPIEAVISYVEVRGETLHTIILRDISERLKTEDTLRKLSLAVERTTESVFITDRDGIIEYVNPAFERLTGYRFEEAIGRSVRILRSGDQDAEFYDRVWTTILSGEVFSGIFTNRKKTGETYSEERSITPTRGDGQQITHFVVAGRDVTDRLRVERELRESREQLRALAAHLESVREEEQIRIAREIHDELGQTLTALKYDLAWLTSRIPEASTVLRDKCHELLSLTDATIAAVRRIASELRPRLLDDLGLEAAVEWLAKTFESRTGIQCQLDSRLGDLTLDPALSTAVFRILQEALTNVVRHANATSVEIDVHCDQNDLIVVVRDDGKGFDASEAEKMNSLGLLGMRERALGLGGAVSVSGAASEGTTVGARFPLTRAAESSGMLPPVYGESNGKDKR